MIYWIASYPRSGNTLLRMILKDVFDHGTYESETFDEDRLPGFFQRVGRAESTQPSWQEFEAWANATPEPVFVKTHKVPKDGNPIIFVLRDGRLSLDSYLSFHHEVNKNAGATLARLIVGDDYYGSWSAFCSAALSAQGKVLVLRFEEILEDTSATVSALSDFTDLPVLERGWDNPFIGLNSVFPNFFRKGHTRWMGGGRWSDVDSSAFALLHGEVMERLGYYMVGEREALLRGLDRELREYLVIAYRQSLARARMQDELEAKEQVIQNLLRSHDALKESAIPVDQQQGLPQPPVD